MTTNNLYMKYDHNNYIAEMTYKTSSKTKSVTISNVNYALGDAIQLNYSGAPIFIIENIEIVLSTNKIGSIDALYNFHVYKYDNPLIHDSFSSITMDNIINVTLQHKLNVLLNEI